MSVIAERRLKQFQQKFGKAMVKFATHAALPVVLNSELVHLLRLNFFYSDTSISYLTEAEFLLSSFCREIGEDLYEIEPAMRTVLLQKLYQQHPKHIKEIAALLWQYTKRYTPWRTREGLQNAQLLTALNFLDGQKASEWFQKVESLDKALSPEDREWFVAMKSKIESEQQLQHSEEEKYKENTEIEEDLKVKPTPIFYDTELKKFIHKILRNAIVKVFMYDEFQSTGFFITPDGYILTAYHCIRYDSPDIVIETFFGERLNVQLDEDKSLKDFDIAVLKILKPNYYTNDCLPLGMISDWHITDVIVSLGYPAEHRTDNQQIGIYFGKISRFRTDNKIEIVDAIRGPGQDGAPIYHYATNRVIGIATAGYKTEVMTNTGVATRFDPLFEKWPELEQINNDVAKDWDKQLEPVNSEFNGTTSESSKKADAFDNNPKLHQNHSKEVNIDENVSQNIILGLFKNWFNTQQDTLQKKLCEEYCQKREQFKEKDTLLVAALVDILSVMMAGIPISIVALATILVTNRFLDDFCDCSKYK
jgi:hypothetical protein